MGNFQLTFATLFLVCVVLVDFGAQARYCDPPCDIADRCVAANPRRRSEYNNVCVPRRCLQLPRRGRCFNFQDYHFDKSTMSCKRTHFGVCYRGGNHFFSHEDCFLTCLPYLAFVGFYP